MFFFQIEWYKNGQLISNSSRYLIDVSRNILQISNVQMTDRGRFTCRATNEAGSLDTDFIFDVSGKYFPFLHEPVD